MLARGVENKSGFDVEPDEPVVFYCLGKDPELALQQGLAFFRRFSRMERAGRHAKGRCAARLEKKDLQSGEFGISLSTKIN